MLIWHQFFFSMNNCPRINLNRSQQCTPKSSMKNLSHRMSGNVKSMNSTFIVEHCTSKNCGKWAKNASLMKRAAKWKEEKRKKKGKGKGRPTKKPEDQSLTMNKYKIPNDVRRRLCLEVKRQKKKQELFVKRPWLFLKKRVFVLVSTKKSASKDPRQNKAKEK